MSAPLTWTPDKCSADRREDVRIIAKACTHCGEVKPLDEFHRQSCGVGGRRPDCSECARVYGAARRAEYAVVYNATRKTKYRLISQTPEVKARSRREHLRRKYGIGQDAYDRKHTEQAGLCAICGRPPVGRKPLSVDHNHETGQVRGLLCTSCNTALGMFGESVDALTSAIAYVMSWQEVERSEDISETIS